MNAAPKKQRRDPRRKAGQVALRDDLRGLNGMVEEWVENLAQSTDKEHKHRNEHPYQCRLEQTYRAWARLWRYSVNNNILIDEQFFDATIVHGRKDWAKLGRSVRPDAEPIVILAPSHKGGFPFVYVEVFDIKQTSGPPHPEADPPAAEELLPKVEAAVGMLGFEVHAARLGGDYFLDSGGFLYGYIKDNKIYLHQSLSPHQRLDTMLHECAHGLMHRAKRKKRQPYRIREAEAEAVAFVVLTALRLPSNAPGYLARFIGEETQILVDSLRRIQRASRIILRAIIDQKEPLAHEIKHFSGSGVPVKEDIFVSGPEPMSKPIRRRSGRFSRSGARPRRRLVTL